MSIHSSAIIHPNATLGRDVSVGPYAVIDEHVEIGDACNIAAHVIVHRFTRIGAGTRIHSGAVLGDLPQDMSFAGGTSYAEIGAGCVIREGVTVHRGTKDNTVTRIGDRCFLMANSHVAHNCVLGNDVILANGVLLGGYAEIGDRAFLSGNCVVHQFCRVGRLAMMSGLSAASKDLPPFCVIRSNTTNHVAGLNIVGLRRAGLTPAERSDIKRAFHLLYRSDKNVHQAVAEMKKSFPSGPASELWEFAETAQRGICGRERAEAGEDD